MRPRIYLYGTPEKFRNYMLAVEAAGGIPCFDSSPQSCDALLLPGGGDIEPWRYGQENTSSQNLEPERDAAELELLDLFVARNKPVLGICRGMQTINVFFGGTLKQDIPGHSQFDGIDRIHGVHAADPSSPTFLSVLYGNHFLVNSAHHQCIDRLGNGLCAAQRASDHTIEAIYHASRPVWAVQWHPERLIDTVSTQAVVNGRLLYRFFVEQI